MSVINTNITSMIGQSNLSKSQNALQTSMERLSSGLRINSAKDDAAGLAQAQRNANDGISVAQTAEGALNQINDNLQRIRELSVQAQNDTNSEDDLSSIQAEINRISDETTFNGTKVLSQDQTLQIQVGANDGEVIDIDLERITAASLGLGTFNVTGSATQQNDAATAENLVDAGFTAGATTAGATTFDPATATDLLGSAANADEVVVDATTYTADGTGNFSTAASTPDTAANTVSALHNKSITITTGSATYTADVDGSGNLSNIVDSSTGTGTANIDGDTALVDVLGKDVTVVDGNDTYTSADTGTTYSKVTTLDATEMASEISGGTTITATVGGDGYKIDPGTSAVTAADDSAVYFDGAALTDTASGTTPAETLYVLADGTVNAADDGTGAQKFIDGATGALTDTDSITVATSTAKPLETLDNALKEVDNLRSDLGAIQNRFDSAITNETNLAAARSRIEDADYAVEVANMTRAQILQQAGTSVLAQANQIPQNVLSLLG
ncbi:flagellin N-terminal helical domain-containing protein [Halomonas hibernica]|uniref:flagellin N-terminal helical domain-containing protein n=1 Tax=Halomonas hibernica TaxID=2591147 RepID=UPI001552B4D5|nr:flagellin [Halomonas hibernica]